MGSKHEKSTASAMLFRSAVYTVIKPIPQRFGQDLGSKKCDSKSERP